MGIVIKKKLVTPVMQVSAISDAIDAYGTALANTAPVVAEIKKLTAQLKPFKEAEAALEKAIDTLQLNDDVEEHMERGVRFQVEIGKRGSKREIKDLAKVRELLAEPLFMKLAKVGLKDLDDYLNPFERDQCLDTKRTEHSAKVSPRAA